MDKMMNKKWAVKLNRIRTPLRYISLLGDLFVMRISKTNATILLEFIGRR